MYHGCESEIIQDLIESEFRKALFDRDTQDFFKRKKFRIYGEALGSVKDVSSMLSALEKIYKTFLECGMIIYESKFIRKDKLHKRGTIQFEFDKQKFKFQAPYYLTPEDVILVIDKVNFNSPGSWDVIGSWNPLSQIRKYVNERHERIKDKRYGWELDKKMKEAELEEKKLRNDQIRLEITKEIIEQLKETGMSSRDLSSVAQDYYKNLRLLDTHIDSGRIVQIEEVDDES
ncbi:MAG: hypothetical protein K2I07_03175 [Lachnospiraceae bacterium]|nr:hypothetical protein [Lachnospiraceae bacterium]